MTTTAPDATSTTTPETGAADATLATAPLDTSAAPQASPQGAPEQYQWTVPDNSPVNATVLDRLGLWAKEQNLTQDSAQSLLDQLLPTMVESQQQQMAQASAEWVDQSRNDPEIGGSRFDENLAMAKKALDQFATPELITILNDSLLGNHPEVIRVFTRIGQKISGDHFVGGTAAPDKNPAPRSFNDLAQALYPNG